MFEPEHKDIMILMTINVIYFLVQNDKSTEEAANEEGRPRKQCDGRFENFDPR